MAVVPASQAQALAARVQDGVRAGLQDLGQTVVERLLDAAGLAGAGCASVQ